MYGIASSPFACMGNLFWVQMDRDPAGRVCALHAHGSHSGPSGFGFNGALSAPTTSALNVFRWVI